MTLLVNYCFCREDGRVVHIRSGGLFVRTLGNRVLQVRERLSLSYISVGMSNTATL